MTGFKAQSRQLKMDVSGNKTENPYEGYSTDMKK